MPQIDISGSDSKLSCDKLQGQSGTTVNVLTGHTLAIADAGGLTVNGSAVPTSSGAWTLIGTSVASASASLTQTGLDSTYAMHVVTFSEIIPSVDGTNPYFRFGDSSGVDSGSTDYQYIRHMIQEGSTTYDGGGGGGNAILMGASVGVNAGEGWNGVFFMGGIGTGSVRPTMSGHWICYGDSPEMRGGSIWGMRDAVITTDRINFFFSGGNIASGRMSVYGISHT